tara:strand:- start:544 stop:2298 length:1755 start_codon:yes stop_codon:yes gene_type:complete
MCGIFLVISKKKKVDRKKCFEVLKNLRKRGPDGFKYNFYNNNKIFLCNTILNITGRLDKKSKSLIKSKSDHYHIAFNGEIYNFKELSRQYLKKNPDNNISDTQILVNLHEKIDGKKIPTLLNGMYAYVIFDQKKKKFIIVNDVQGEKNLYMYETKNEIIFSSNVSSIFKFYKKLEINENIIKNYFYTRHFIPFNETCYKGVKVLNPGSYFSIKVSNLTIKKEIFEDPLDWIDEKKYKINLKLSENQIINRLNNLLKTQAKKMIPKTNFGCIFSGGIDSSLQSGIINKIKKPNILAVLHHEGKDKITEKIYDFQKFFKTRICKINITPEKYLRDLLSIYKISKLPIYTHSVVGIHQISNFFKKKNCKVYFSADGADELFGGYKIYEKIDWKSNNSNLSPYSSINQGVYKTIKIKDKKYKQNLNNFRNRVRKKYSFLNNKKDINIQSNLFCDYFIQAVKVGNACNDLVGSDNSVEIRNIFVQKSIIKEIINIPAKFKINLENQNKFKLKIILKKLFAKYFDNKYIFEKQGFSGFPNEVKNHSKIKFKYIKRLLGKRNFNKYKTKRDFEWKFINLELFKKQSYKQKN